MLTNGFLRLCRTGCREEEGKRGKGGGGGGGREGVGGGREGDGWRGQKVSAVCNSKTIRDNEAKFVILLENSNKLNNLL